MKKCTKCKEEKPLSEFYPRKRAKSGLQSACKACSRKGSLTWRNRHLELCRERSKEWSKQNPEKRNEGQRKRRAANLEKFRGQGKIQSRKRRTGFTDELFYQKLEEQQERCAICLVSLYSLPSNKVCADHCHKKNKTRGVLCSSCNSALGLFYDDPRALREAALYIEKYQKEHNG